MSVAYQVVDVFTTDPTLKGWSQIQGTTMAWDSTEKVGVGLGSDADCRYIKYLGKPLTQSDYLIALFTFMTDNVALNTGSFLVGFFNVGESVGKDECVALFVDNSSGAPRPHIYIAYDDGTTKVIGTGSFTLNEGDKYVACIRHVPEDAKAYLDIYDFVTQQLLFSENITIDEDKTFSLNQVGISEYGISVAGGSEGWIYDMNAVAEPEPIDYASLYATPEQIRKLTNLDACQDMDDAMLAQIQTVYAIPQVNSKFRAEGYDAPFDTGDDTPPLIRTITALLTVAYVARKSYTGHSPNESPLYESMLEEINEIWMQLHKGELELIDKDGNWIQRSMATSTDMLSTTEGQLTLFTLDDVPDITSVMTGRGYFGRAGSSHRD